MITKLREPEHPMEQNTPVISSPRAGYIPRRGLARQANGTSFPVALSGAGCLGILAIFGPGPNFGLCLLSVFVLFAGSWLSWRPGEPAIAIFIFGFQWLQASIAIFISNLQGISIDDATQLSYLADMQGATALTLVGLLIIFACFRFTAGPLKRELIQRARGQAQILSVKRLAIAYVASATCAWILTYVSTFSGGLRQPLLAFASFKDAVFIIIAYVGFVRGGPYKNLFWLVFGIELLGSLGAYFSSFQRVFVYTFVAMFAANVRLNFARQFLVAMLIAVAVFFGIVWTAVKEDYRAYLNGNSGQQVVVVGRSDAVGTLVDMSLNLDGAQLVTGADNLAKRLTYVEFFASSMNHVPRVVDHTHGELWLRAIVHPFTPRILFPDKAIIDSSADTNQYSGVAVAGWEQGTQISIGYMGESYIDFGSIGMFVPLAVYGLMMGLVYRWVISLPKFSGLIGMSLSVPLLMGGSYLNAETIKIVGSLITIALAIFVSHAFAGSNIVRMLFGRRVPF